MSPPAKSAVGVIGVGYVGLVTATCFADLGHQVVCRDINPQRVADLRKGAVPIYEPGIERLLERNRDRLTFTEDGEELFGRCRVVFVCVDTPPTRSGDADLSRVHRVIDELPADGERLVLVMKSTVPVGTGDKVRAELDGRGRGHVGYVSNPEFLREGRAIADFMEPDRIVIGALDEADGAAVEALYADLVELVLPGLRHDNRRRNRPRVARRAGLSRRRDATVVRRQSIRVQAAADGVAGRRPHHPVRSVCRVQHRLRRNAGTRRAMARGRAAPLPQPDLTILLDIAPATAVARKQAGRDRYERDVALLERVRASYQRQAQTRGWVRIDGEQSRDAIAAAVAKAVFQELTGKG